MVAISKIVFVATAAAGVIAAPSQQHGPLVQFNEAKQLPTAWTSLGQANRDTMIKAQIGLKQNNMKGLHDKLMDISNPESPNYGKWLSKEEVDQYSAPAAADVAAVKAWLASNGITDVSMPSNDWIEFTVPVHQMESLIAAKYELFQHSSTGAKVPRTTQYSVPQNLHSVIDVVTPTTAFYSKIAPQIHDNSAQGTAASGLVSPAYIKSAYNVDYTPSGNQLIASTGFLGIGASHQDYAAFGRQFVSGLKDFKDVSVNGGSNSGDGSQLEGNLDTQYMGGVGHPLQSEYLAVAPTGSDDTSFNDALLAMANYLNTNANPPSVVSTSYGAEERTLDGSYLDRICNEFMKAGSRGVSVFFSSGDHGNGGNSNDNSCNNGYYGTWPASCPYITSVGGTEYDSNNNEVVANFAQYTNGQITSPGGGYSEHFAAPDYNKNVTAAYAATLNSNMQSRLNAKNRGYPDISLVSVKFQTNVNGKISQVLGTSASSPAIAALFGALNDYRKSKGQANLGFINPLLYSAKVKPALRDVTSGKNPGCDSIGFSAQSGWDAASGLGSFDFAKLRALI